MTKRKKLLWKLYPTYLFTIIPALVVIALIASQEIRASFLRQISVSLKARALLMVDLVTDQESLLPADRIDETCKRMGSATSTRYTVILPDGRVIGDSQEDPSSMHNHADRPEIRRALQIRTGQSTRHSDTLDMEMMYLAVPVMRGGEPVAVVRTSVPVTTIQQTLHRVYREIALAGLVVALLAAFASFFVAYQLGKPLREMEKGALRFANGELDYQLPVPDTEETGTLAESMNLMARQLDSRIRTVTRQRNELEAVLSSMVEAVLVVDRSGKMIRSNLAARKLFNLDGEQEEGRTIREAIHNADLNRFVTSILDGEGPLTDDILLHRNEESHLLAHGTSLMDARGDRIGALVVLHDVTQLKKLERIRRDFVANVSHELRTPITSIKGFVETLNDGALDDPDNARRFLGIILRHVDRLNAIIEDLMSLSRIEQENESGRIALKSGSVCDVLSACEAVIRVKARKSDVELEFSCDETLRAQMNRQLMEQAVVNLLDNAIKFSEAGSTVGISALARDGEVVIEVEDQGPGIAREHQERIFERFYRVDRARSRKAGGTGLGLAIVKHIAQAHGGHVSLKSSPGHGSTFRIHLPA